MPSTAIPTIGGAYTQVANRPAEYRTEVCFCSIPLLVSLACEGAEAAKDMLCFWCQTECESLTDDHIIPYSLGGTAEYTVKACSPCQNRLSKAELEVSRKSMLAIHALVAPVAPRHPDRPTSGHLRPSFFLVKHPDGGYGESLLSAGERVSLLPYFEIKVVPGEPLEGRVRGTTEGARRLLAVFRSALKRTPGPDRFLFQITANLDLDDSVSSDVEFWPRIVLLPGDRLLLRARSPEELMRFMQVFTELANSDYTVPEKWSKPEIEIKGGTPHLIALRFDPQAERRIAAKIGYGLFRIVTGRSLEAERDSLMRSYILGLADSKDEPVSIEPIPLNFTTSDKPHCVTLSPAQDRQAILVSLYGHRFRVELGPEGELPVPVVLLCQIDGSGMRVANPDETSKILKDSAAGTFSQPWKQVPEVPQSTVSK